MSRRKNDFISSAIRPKVVMSIGNKFITHFKKITLNQKINEHHTFEIVLDHDVVEELGSHTLDRSKDWLGTSLTISFSDKDFLGYITGIQMLHTEGFDGDIIITGASPTLLLEAGPHTQSWTEKSLTTIINDVVKDVNMQVAIAPTYKEVIPYEVQYNESHFHFLQRMASKYNEWLFYDGTQLCFGKPSLAKTTTLQYGQDMHNVDIQMQTFATRKKQISYHAAQDNQFADKTRNTVNGLNELGFDAFEASKKLYTIVPQELSPSYVEDKMRIDRELARSQSEATALGNVFKATSSKAGLGLASVVKISAARFKNIDFDMSTMTQTSIKKKINFDIKQYGEYIITEIVHTANNNYEYSNDITALPGGLEVLPAPEITKPIAQPELAKVISNTDPKNQGRVQVQFFWQNGIMRSDWIRVMTPDAGKGNEHSKNRGHVFIPETGDQVMVGFEYGDPNRPYVQGGMFHGRNGAGGKQNNNIKSIITRSGHMIEFNDTDNAESITITDKNKNIVFIDTANNNIEISANETMTFNCKNMNINVAENMNTMVGNHISENAGQNINMVAGTNISQIAGNDFVNKSINMSEEVDENMDVSAKLSQDVVGKLDIASTVENLNFNSSKSIVSNTNEQSNFQ